MADDELRAELAAERAEKDAIVTRFLAAAQQHEAELKLEQRRTADAYETADGWKKACEEDRAKVEKLRAALQPFADWLTKLGEENIFSLVVDHYKNAAAALEETAS